MMLEARTAFWLMGAGTYIFLIWSWFDGKRLHREWLESLYWRKHFKEHVAGQWIFGDGLGH